jgi:hypothetical protein
MLGNLDGHREVKGAVQPQWLAEICFMENRTGDIQRILINVMTIDSEAILNTRLIERSQPGPDSASRARIARQSESLAAPIGKIFLPDK